MKESHIFILVKPKRMHIQKAKTSRGSKMCLNNKVSSHFVYLPFEPRREKTGLRGFRPGPTQTGLYINRICLDA